MTEDTPMSLEAETILAVRSSRDLKLEAVANGTGYSTTHISEMERGCRPVSTQFLRAFFAYTGDIRIPRLIVPELQAVSNTPPLPTPMRIPPPARPAEANRYLCECMRRVLHSLEMCDAITSDDRVDERDDAQISACMDDLAAVRDAIPRFVSAMMSWRDRTIKTGARA